ncbi:MAG: hypothetical protein HQM08_21515 [Candidatus Riflebacteria bacterium]|nr:hypothetical protein [Candidatus Riflebacteria bacterium]
MKSAIIRNFTLMLAVIAFITLFGEFRSAEAKGRHKKVGIFTRISRTVKRNFNRTCKKVHRGIVNAGCSVTNKVMDGAVNVKTALTGKKKYTWVEGHYKKGNKHHTSGHFRRIIRHKKSGGTPGGTTGTGTPGAGVTGIGDVSGTPSTANDGSSQGFNGGGDSFTPQSPTGPSTPSGSSLPAVDPVMPQKF